MKKDSIGAEEAGVDKHAVLYTDGGCRPARGIGGWGFHGYIFTNTPPKQGSGCKNGYPSYNGYITDDKAKRPETPPVTVVSYVDGWGSLIPKSSNNEAELEAAIEALSWVITQDVRSVLLKLDSQYVLEGLRDWVYKWMENNWRKVDGTPVANEKLWTILHKKRVALEELGITLDLEWVKGHSGAIGNEAADKLATAGIIVGRKDLKVHEIVISDPKGYWSRNISYNRMLSQSRWYFNTNVGGALKSQDGRWIYHLGDHGSDDDLFGKRVSDTHYSIVYLKEPDPVIELIRSFQDEVAPIAYNSVVIGKLDKLLNPDVYSMIQKSGSLLLHSPLQTVDLYTASDVPITKEMRPARLAFAAIDSLTQLEGLLNDYIDNPSNHKLTVTDLTDLLYDKDEKAKKPTFKLKPEINNNLKALEVDAKFDIGIKSGTAKLTLTMGIDIATRNTLSALSSKNPKVSLITWRESDTAFRYATIIETEDDIGIWAGVYSNIRLLSI